jgi:hypothetical protein
MEMRAPAQRAPACSTPAKDFLTKARGTLCHKETFMSTPSPLWSSGNTKNGALPAFVKAIRATLIYCFLAAPLLQNILPPSSRTAKRTVKTPADTRRGTHSAAPGGRSFKARHPFEKRFLCAGTPERLFPLLTA